LILYEIKFFSVCKWQHLTVEDTSINNSLVNQRCHGKLLTSLRNLGSLLKPVDTLIKKISKAVGGIVAPYQIKRIAKAKTEPALIEAHSKIKMTEMHRGAAHRSIEEEAQLQKNVEALPPRHCLI